MPGVNVQDVASGCQAVYIMPSLHFCVSLLDLHWRGGAYHG